MTYTVTYADANFNTSTLAAANITLNKTGTANGTRRPFQRLGPDPHGHDQRHYGRRLAGDFDRGRHGLGPGRQPGPGRRPERDLHGGQHGADDRDRRPSASYRRRRAGHLHGDLRRRELQRQHAGRGEHHAEQDRYRQRHARRRQRHGTDSHGHHQRALPATARWGSRSPPARPRTWPATRPRPPAPAPTSRWTTRPPRSRSLPPRRPMPPAGR